MDEKKYIGVFLPVMMINIFFVVSGVKVVVKYLYDTNDWHFWAALAGLSVFVSFSIGMVVGYFLLRRRSNSSVENKQYK
jgi:Kef-type K+ transport system membrane component KefB